jgi:hypothetical protein
MDSAQKGQGRRLGGSIKSSRPTKGVVISERRNHPTAERPNSREASKATAKARRQYRPIPIPIASVLAERDEMKSDVAAMP